MTINQTILVATIYSTKLHRRHVFPSKNLSNFNEKCVCNQTNLNYYSQLYHTLNESFAAFLFLLECVIINLLRCHTEFFLRCDSHIADCSLFLRNFHHNLHIQQAQGDIGKVRRANPFHSGGSSRQSAIAWCKVSVKVFLFEWNSINQRWFFVWLVKLHSAKVPIV